MALKRLSADLKCAWLGPSPGGLGWLRKRVGGFSFLGRQVTTVFESPSLDISAIQSLLSTGLDRIILACADRISYPAVEIAWLQRNIPDVPFAVATDNWWDGSRRTGIGMVDHSIIPWYRWWDSWTGWLAGTEPQLFGPCQLCGSANYQTTKLGSAEVAGNAVIVANCRQMAEAWALQARSFGAKVRCESTCSFQSCGQALDFDWLLWDDSCMDTVRGAAAEAQMLDFFVDLSIWHPQALGIAALSCPRFDSWNEVADSGHREFVAKPNNGQSLHNILRSNVLIR